MLKTNINAKNKYINECFKQKLILNGLASNPDNIG